MEEQAAPIIVKEQSIIIKEASQATPVAVCPSVIPKLLFYYFLRGSNSLIIFLYS